MLPLTTSQLRKKLRELDQKELIKLIAQNIRKSLLISSINSLSVGRAKQLTLFFLSVDKLVHQMSFSSTLKYSI
ncbi:hypothetical protein GCM10011538_11450 [Ligilactobacillus murinus]